MDKGAMNVNKQACFACADRTPSQQLCRECQIVESFNEGHTAGWEEAIGAAAKVALNWGYSWCENKEQPFAREFNLSLRTQNKAIAEKILTLKESQDGQS